MAVKNVRFELPQHPGDYDELMFIIGGKDELIFDNAYRMAVGVVAACTINKHAPITLSLDGYDDDPREIWEIPECVMYIRWFVDYMERCSTPEFVEQIRQRLTPESMQWRKPS